MRIRQAAAIVLIAVSGTTAGQAARADLLDGIRLFQALEYAEAEAVLSPLAGGGDGLASWYLGLMRDPNYHSPTAGRYYQTDWLDLDKAVAHYERAVDLDEPYAYYSLAALYGNNWIQHRRANAATLAVSLRKRARPYLERRAAAGDGVAAFMLADLRRHEPPTRPRAEVAYRLLLAEAMEGRPLSQLHLARAFETGLLFVHEGRGRETRDMIHAFAWYSIAAVHGEQHAPKHQFTVAEQLGKRQFDDAEELTDQLLERIVQTNRSQ